MLEQAHPPLGSAWALVRRVSEHIVENGLF
jgi:hypothetical protein